MSTAPLAKKISSPAYMSPTTPKPPSVCIDPVVVLVDSVESSIDRTPDPVMVVALRAAVANVPPATVRVSEL